MERFKIMIATIGALAMANAASASMIMLSEMSSDETDAGLLNATFDFSVAGNVLSLTVTNTTDNNPFGFEFDINELYFNAPDGVTLSLVQIPGWQLQTGAMADGFGVFDFALIDGQGGNPSQITPGESVTFTLNITAGTPGKIDFVSLLSDPQPPMRGAIIAAKFVNGNGDDSAYGATIPAPGVLALFGAACLVGGRRRRRRV